VSVPSKEAQLVMASLEGNLATVQRLLRDGAKADYFSSDKNVTALAAAIKENHDAIAEVLLPLDQDTTGVALSYAYVSKRSQWACRIIRQYKMFPKSKDAFLIALEFCKRYNDTSVLQALFENKNLNVPHGDIDREIEKYSPRKSPAESRTREQVIQMLQVYKTRISPPARPTVKKSGTQPSFTTPQESTVKPKEKKSDGISSKPIQEFNEACNEKQYRKARELLTTFPELKKQMPDTAHQAILKEDIDTVNVLLEMQLDPNAISFLNTLLQSACNKGNVPIAKALLHAGADVNKASGNTNPPIVSACLSGQIPLVKLLLEFKPKLPSRLFDVAFEQGGKHEIIQLLLNRDTLSPDEKDDAIIEVCRQFTKLPKETDNSSAIHLITETVEMLLENGAEKNSKKLLAALAHVKDNAALTALLKREIADDSDRFLDQDPINAKSTIEYDQLRIAIQSNRTNTKYLKRLYREVVLPDAGLNNRHPYTPFYWAAAMDLLDEVKKMLPPEHSKDRARELDSAFNAACLFGRLDVLQFFIELNIVPNQQSLANASAAGHLDVVEFLLQKNAPTEAALYKACQYSRVDVVRKLLTDKRVDRNEVVDGKTALQVAREQKCEEVMVMLGDHPSSHGKATQAEESPIGTQATKSMQDLEFSVGSNFLAEVSAYATHYLKTKKFSRGKLKYELAKFVLAKLSNKEGWTPETYTKENLLAHSVDLSELKNSDLLTKKQKNLLANTTHMTLDEVLNFQRYLIHGPTTRSYDNFHPKPTIPRK